jgi:hypothetical protein
MAYTLGAGLYATNTHRYHEQAYLQINFQIFLTLGLYLSKYKGE